MTYEFIESPNHSSRKGNQVIGLISHFTAAGAMGDTVRYMCNQVRVPQKLQGKDLNKNGYVTRNGITYYDARAAAHYCTGREGRTVQLVKENRAAWHAGSKTTKPSLNGKGSINLWSIGHEICNWGGLRKKGSKFYCWPGDWTKLYTGPEPVQIPRNVGVVAESYLLADGSPAFPDNTIEYWEPYTDEQIKAIITLWSEIVGRYGITKEWVAGHEKVDPTRKIDPGPAFPWDYILSEVFPSTTKKQSDLLYPDGPPEDTLTGDPSEEVVFAEKHTADDRSKEAVGICYNIASWLVD